VETWEIDWEKIKIRVNYNGRGVVSEQGKVEKEKDLWGHIPVRAYRAGMYGSRPWPRAARKRRKKEGRRDHAEIDQRSNRKA